MPLGQCRECKEWVSSDAPTCPKCGAPRPVTFPIVPPPNRRRAGARWPLVVASGAVVVAGMAFAASGRGPTSVASQATGSQQVSARAENDQRLDAYGRCVDLLTARLKAPSSADISGPRHSGYARRGKRITFNGAVSAQNPFGVMLREDWHCLVSLESARPVVVTLTLTEDR